MIKIIFQKSISWKKLFLLPLLIILSTAIFGQGISLTANPTAQNCANYQTVNYTFNVIPNGGFNQQVFFSILSTNLPLGYSSSFSVNPISFPYTGGTDLSITLNNPSPTIFSCYIIIQAGNGPVQVQDTVYLYLVGAFCNWLLQASTPNEENKILIDNNNDKWIYGLNANGLDKYNGSTWTNFSTSNSNIPSNQVKDIALDRTNNYLWLATDSGLVKFDGTFWTVYNTANSLLPCNNLNSVAIDTGGNIWIGAGWGSVSYLGGLIEFDGTSNWQLYNSSNSTVFNGEVSLVRIDHLNNIWVVSENTAATHSNLNKFNGSIWTEYSGSSSCFKLFRDVKDIAFDSNNVLWISAGNNTGSVPNASCGLIRFDETTWEIWNRNNLTPFNHRKFDLNCASILQDNTSPFYSEDNASIAIDNADLKWFCIDGDGSGMHPSVWSFNDFVFTKWDYTNSVFNSYGRAGIDIDTNDIPWVVYSGNLKLYEGQCVNAPTIPTMVDEFLPDNFNINVFPNPVATYVEIAFSKTIHKGILEIYNTLGENVLQENIYDTTKKELNLQAVSNGIYLVKLFDGEKYYCKKIIIERD